MPYSVTIYSMEFNRLVSLVIGFIVLILLFVWIASRFRASSNTADKPTPTITVTFTPTPSGEKKGWNPLGFLFKGKTSTPTPTSTESKTTVKEITTTPEVTIATSNTQVVVDNNQQISSETVVYKNNRNGSTMAYNVEGVRQIPQTGVPTLVIPLALSALSMGAYLKKRS